MKRPPSKSFLKFSCATSSSSNFRTRCKNKSRKSTPRDPGLAYNDLHVKILQPFAKQMLFASSHAVDLKGKKEKLSTVFGIFSLNSTLIGGKKTESKALLTPWPGTCKSAAFPRACKLSFPSQENVEKHPTHQEWSEILWKWKRVIKNWI